MHAAEIGVIITVATGGYDLSQFTTVNLLITGPTVNLTRVATVQAGNVSASYTTIAADFPVAGNYTLQLQGVSASKTIYSDPVSINVGAHGP